MLDWRYYKNLLCWFVIHATHWSLYLGNCVSLLYIVAYEPWYIALPWITVLGNPVIGGIHCAYNNIENTYRARLGWQLIERDFLPHAIKTIRKLLKKDN